MKTSRVGRVVQLLTSLQSGRDYTTDDLSRMFQTSRRTIFRDLKELAGIGVPYRYNAKTKGYAIDPEFFLPPINLNVREALSLLLLVHKVRNQVQLPFRNAALLAALKIENNLPGQIRKYCNNALRTISAKSLAQAPTELLDSRFAELQEAIVSKHKVALRYDSLFEGGCIDTEVCPYHLLYNQRAWYLLGYSAAHRMARTFKLNRIKELKALEQCFCDGEAFDVQEYLGRAWSMIPEGRIYDIRLRFSPKVASNVAEVQWHSTQKVTHNGDGSAIVEFRVDGLGEITWWILGYGDQVEVLAPRRLRRRIKEVAQNMARLNTDE
jgi:predicted DNA-binding transcriptional regulator YafY